MKWLWSIILCVVLVGCTSTSFFGKSSKAESKAATRIEMVDKRLAMTDKEKLQQIGSYSYGTDLSLRFSNVATAKQLNDRVITLAEPVSLEERQNMECIVFNLLTNIEHGEKLLAQKDKEVISLQKKVETLNTEKQQAVSNYIAVAGKTALQADTTKAELQEWTGWFGLKGVAKGLMQFGKSALWFIVIGSILFLVLRVLAMSNPIAGAVFSVFNIFGSWCINIISFLIPKAVDTAKLVTKEAYDLTHDTLVKVVDSVEQADVQAVKEHAAKVMDTGNKEVVSTIKKKLLYK